MTSFVYPADIPGLTLEVVRTPIWNTGVQAALSRKRSTIAYMFYPVIHFELKYELLRDDLATSELKELVGLFNACKGQFDTFLFIDPDFNTIPTSSPQQFGTGDGSTTTFQIVAFYQNSGGPGYREIVQNLNALPQIYKNAVLLTLGTDYTLGPTGIVTFSSAPAGGAALTWAGVFLYRCAFDEDKISGLAKIMNKWWELPTIKFTSVPL